MAKALRHAAPATAGAHRFLSSWKVAALDSRLAAQSTDLVLVAMNQQGLQHMLHNKFKIGGDAAASAGPVGRNAQAGTDWKLNAEFPDLLALEGFVCRYRP